MIVIKLITIGCLLLTLGANLWCAVSMHRMITRDRRINEIEMDLKDYKELLELLLDIENERTKCRVLNDMIAETKREIEELEKEYKELTKEGNE